MGGQTEQPKMDRFLFYVKKNSQPALRLTAAKGDFRGK